MREVPRHRHPPGPHCRWRCGFGRHLCGARPWTIRAGTSTRLGRESACYLHFTSFDIGDVKIYVGAGNPVAAFAGDSEIAAESARPLPTTGILAESVTEGYSWRI